MSNRTPIRQAAASVMESMEQRRLMSVSVSSAGLMEITGTNAKDDYILQGDAQGITVKFNGTGVGWYANAAVKNITVSLLGGDDRVFVDKVNQKMKIFGGDGKDTLYGGNNNDLIEGGEGNDLVFGGKGGDLIRGQAGDDVLNGNDGDDQIIGGTGKDFMTGGAGFDFVSYADHTQGVKVALDGSNNNGASGEKDTIAADFEGIFGSPYADTLTGNDQVNIIHAMNGNDTLSGRGGNDSLYGGVGNDLLIGGADNDLLTGHADNDTLLGESGNDTLMGEAGNDSLSGGLGDDLLKADTGKDILSGGDGIDRIDYRESTKAVRITLDNIANDGTDNGAEKDNLKDDIEIVFGSKFNDYLAGGSGYNALFGEQGNDSLFGNGGTDIIYGGDGNDKIYGGSDNDTLYGGTGNDSLYGETGNDKILGEAGHDGLFGGQGLDTLTGGTGNDRFLLHRRLVGSVVLPADDRVVDRITGVDAVVQFSDSLAKTDNHTGSTQRKYDKGMWSDREITLADEALGAAHWATNYSAQTLSPVGNTMTFFKIGRQTKGNAHFAPWRSQQLFQDSAFKSDTDLRRSVLSSLGATHYAYRQFVDGTVSAFSSDWKDVAKWRDVNDGDYSQAPSYQKAQYSEYYKKGSSFVSNYAKTTQENDFGETFSKLIQQKAGWSHGYDSAAIKEQFVTEKLLKRLSN